MSSKSNEKIKVTMKALKEDLLRWICEKQATNSSLNRRLLREKALALTKTHGPNGFKCSENWLTNFLKEHGFSTSLIHPIGPIFNNYRDWVDLMRSTITRYKHHDLFHVDELTMYSDIFPSRITILKDEAEGNIESTRNHITVLICCDSTGTTKLPLLICGPYPSQILEKDYAYCQTENSFITEDLFKNWMLDLNNRMARCNRNILLLLRRVKGLGFKEFSFSNVNLLFFPDNFPSHLRPLRRDVFHYVKMIYRQSYAKRLMQFPMKWDLQDIVETVVKSWEKVPREIIISSFQRTHFRTDDSFLQIDCDFWDHLDTGITFKKFVTFDDDLSDVQSCEKYINRNQHSYNLRTNPRQAIQLDDDSLDSPINEEPNSNQTHRSNKNSRNITRHIESIYQKSYHQTTTHDPTSTKNPRSNKEGPLKKNLGGTKSQKIHPNDIIFSTDLKNNDRRKRKLPSLRRSNDPNFDHLKSIEEDVTKEKGHQRETTAACNVTESLQAIIDKALTLTSTTKADYARRLIDSICASNEEARRSIVAQSHYTDEEGRRLLSETKIPRTNTSDEHENEYKSADKELERSRNLFGSEVTDDKEENPAQPSTSMDYRGPLNDSWDGSNKEPRRELCLNKSDKSEANNLSNEGRDRNSLGDESFNQEASKTAKKRRWAPGNMDGSGDDSNNSELGEKRARRSYNWTKEFETTFVFGPSSALEPARSSDVQDVDSVDSCRSSERSKDRQSSSGEKEETCVFDIRP